MRFTFAWIIVSLLYAAVSFAANQTEISGTAFGYNGKPILRADVHLFSYSDPAANQFTEADKNGKYSLKTTKPGYYDLVFFGVNHQPLSVSVFIDGSGKKIEIDARLASLELAKDLHKIQVVVEFADGKKRTIAMNARPDGSFAAEVENKGENIFCQVISATENSLALPSTNANSYEYDGEGSYKSIFKPETAKTLILFSPGSLPKEKTFPQLSSKNKELNASLANFLKLQLSNDKFMRAISRFQIDTKSDSLKPIVLQALNEIEQLLDEPLTPEFRQIFFVDYCSMARIAYQVGIEEIVNAAIIDKTIQEVPANSELWTKNYQLPVPMAAMTGYVFDIPFLDSIVRFHPSESVREYNFFALISEAYKTQNSETARKYFNLLRREFPSSQAIQSINKSFHAVQKVKTGDKIPDFKLSDLDNTADTITIEKLKGKYVLIDFWATWCGPCLREMHILEEVYTKFKSDKFEIFSISFDKNADIVKQFRKNKWKMPWIHAFADGGFSSAVGKDFGIIGIPTPILIDPEGKVIARDSELRGAYLKRTLTRVLGN